MGGSQLTLDFDAEEWRPVVDWLEYQVSSYGRVRRVARGKGTLPGKILKPTDKGRGYMQVSLHAPGKKTKKVKVQVLVCTAFHGTKPTGRHESAHWDGNPRNNRADNLRWATKKENEEDKKRHGTYQYGVNNVSNKLSEQNVRDIRQRYAAGGVTQRALAREYGLHQVTVSEIVLRKIWEWVR